jgi:uncharacterized membrane protein
MQQDVTEPRAPAFRRVPSGNGAQWWGSAWQLLFHRGAAGVWIAMCLIAMILLAVLHLVPMLGSLASQVGSFIFAGGLMLAARKTDQGTPPEVGDLFAGFGPSMGALTLGGLLVMIALVLVIGAIAMAGAGAVFGAVFGGAFGGAFGGPIGSLGALTGIGLASAFLILAFLLLMVPVGMAAWLAPALIVFRQQQPFEALKSSLAACWANLGALTVYGLLWIGFAIVASIPLGLGWLVLAPLMALSTYCACQDLFVQA